MRGERGINGRSGFGCGRLAALGACGLALAVVGTPGLAMAQSSNGGTQVSPDAAEPTVTHGGTLWVKAKSEIEGSFRIEETAEGRFLVIGRGIDARKPPEPLRVVLSPLGVGDDRPRGVREAGNKNALEGGLVLGNLARIDGKGPEQRFRIPEGTDLSTYNTVLLHCERYEVLWGGTPLHEGQVIASGDAWTKKNNDIRGSYEIARDAEGYVIRLGEDFRTRRAPDLKFVLTGQRVRSASDRNALSGDAVIVAPLKSERGAQSIRVPAGVDPRNFRSLLIHCEQFTKLWGGSDLRFAAGA